MTEWGYGAEAVGVRGFLILIFLIDSECQLSPICLNLDIYLLTTHIHERTRKQMCTVTPVHAETERASDSSSIKRLRGWGAIIRAVVNCQCGFLFFLSLWPSQSLNSSSCESTFPLLTFKVALVVHFQNCGQLWAWKSTEQIEIGFRPLWAPHLFIYFLKPAAVTLKRTPGGSFEVKAT